MRLNKHSITPLDIERARELRKTQTPMEAKLWDALRENGKNKGLKFRRQQPIHPYIADLVCMEKKVVIEIDGLSHDLQQEYDQMRTGYLENKGYKVLRFLNEDIITNLDGVVDTILNEVSP